MNMKDILALGLKGMSERRFRTILTVLTVTIGVATIVALISLVSGVTASISSSLSSIGPTTIYMSARGAGSIFTNVQVAELESLPNVSSVIPILSFSANVTTLNGESTTATIFGIENSSLESVLGSLNMESGSLYSDSAQEQGVVGYSIAFPTSSSSQEVQLDEPLYLSNIHASQGTITATIAPTGVLGDYGTSFFVDPDTSIFIPLSQAESIMGKYSYNILVVKATSLASTTALDTELTDIFGTSATILSVQSLTSTVESITGSLSLLLGSIGGISLIVAGVGILSIMMVSVSERTREIGILKAIGFKQRDVLVLFLSEALIIGFTGGVVGVIAGAGGSYILPAMLSGSFGGSSAASASASTSASASSSSFRTSSASGYGGAAGSGSYRGGSAGGFGGPAASSPTSSISSIKPVITINTAILAIALAMVISVLSGLYPAWKASKVDPIIALRSE